ncbi:putative membrane protein [Candidatus Ichthyocystis hellenicum]|uniref:Putative membrane protein n=1 Tax=Candidatus Ichthyocystis hellenicum TaxID=1561003 RepID=A0A0S4M5Y3_9BURK|nr:hypothetical protein [Candidatus Ichthyocystis hellenicum]CUT17544.1 putative membrane protein [Candidatus Ichthyocystis hellenicum]
MDRMWSNYVERCFSVVGSADGNHQRDDGVESLIDQGEINCGGGVSSSEVLTTSSSISLPVIVFSVLLTIIFLIVISLLLKRVF